MRKVLSLLLLVAGTAIVVAPHLRVWRLKHEVLDLVPVPDGTVVVAEEVQDSPLVADDFLLAYRAVSDPPEAVREALLADGFEQIGRPMAGSPTYAKPCCGSYDAVIVRVFEGRDGLGVAHISVQDDGITSSWIVMTIIGLVMVTTGVVSWFLPRRGDSTVPPRADHTAFTPV